MKHAIYRFIIRVWGIFPFKKSAAYLIKNIPFINLEKLYIDLKYKGEYRVLCEKKSFKLYNHGDSTIENDIFWKGLDAGWENVSLKIWTQLVKKSNTIFDIGANTGIYSIVAATINPEAKIYAFEPSNNSYTRFEKNININNFKNIYPFQQAVSNKNGSSKFFDYSIESQLSASLNNHFIKDVDESLHNIYEVNTVSLDNFIKSNTITKIDLLKIDVEMHEPEVLNGMKEILKTQTPTILIEVLSDEMGQEIEKILKPLSYLFFSINEIDEPKLENSILKSPCYNYLVCQKNIAKELNLIAN